MNATDIERSLCTALCASVTVTQCDPKLWRVDTPWTFPDGDGYSIYISPSPIGGLRVSDQGITLMRMSYENDISKLRDGTRGRLLAQVLADAGLYEDNGEFFLDTTVQDLGATVLRLGQALTRVHDLTFLNRARVENTFYEDLREKLHLLVGKERLVEQYVVPGIDKGDDYRVDYYITDSQLPMYLFGVPNKDKARLSTIILQHLNRFSLRFDSMIIFKNAADIPTTDLGRLMNAANDMIYSLDATDDFQRKLLRRVG